ncbi:MAG: MobC family plasmid mobilization relaxosome protein [Defluviitaleaceae bacterium]|nr:MobC family plasmid mobilization relaxosome protein [Defluviitaleaceae bacterium]
MQNLKRKINMGFRVTEEEQQLVRQRMDDLGIRNLRAYLLKMALNGYVINLDMSEINECSRLLRTVSNNVNQIARHANTIGAVYADDMTAIKNRLDEVWQQQNKIINSLAKVIEVV